MTDQDLAKYFLHAYNRPGGMHWVFNGMRDCVNKWQRRGIDGMPDPTPGAVALLADAIAADDAWYAALRAKA